MMVSPLLIRDSESSKLLSYLIAGLVIFIPVMSLVAGGVALARALVKLKEQRPQLPVVLARDLFPFPRVQKKKGRPTPLAPKGKRNSFIHQSGA